MSDTPAPVVAAAEPPAPTASLSIHGPFLEKAIPDWLVYAVPQRREQLKASETPLPDWYLRASPAQRTALHDSCAASFSAQTFLDKAMTWLQDVDSFARPLLVAALKDQFDLELDVDETYLMLRKPLEAGIFSVEIIHFEVLRLPLLQAALHNFEASECEPDAFHATSGFLKKTATSSTFQAITPALSVTQFTTLCRSLDIGAKYQTYLKKYLRPRLHGAYKLLRRTFNAAQQTALHAAAKIALLKQDIEPRDYTMVLSVVEGNFEPWMDGKRVGICDFGLMNRQMTGCLLFSIGDVYGRSDELILYIPNDPEYPLKRYTRAEMARLFKQRFTARDATSSNDGSPTAYQRFFSQFVAYADRPYYFSQFTQDKPGLTLSEKLQPYAALLNKIVGFLPFSALYQLNELPPAPLAPQAPNPDPYLAPGALLRKGPGVWTRNLWSYLFDQYRDKLLADARAHAVPSADVDARVRSEKFAHLLDIGMLVLTGASMFVPVLSELMMGAMVAQLLAQTLDASHEWNEGDRRAAKAHLIDVAQNLTLMAAMAGGAKGLAKLTAVKAEPVLEGLEQVTLPNGKTRLWRPDLGGYESTVSLDGGTGPNTQGQYELDGKTYIRQDGKVYQQTFDESRQRWRIVHPTDPQAYQPVLTHNGAGAWRHTLERPRTWERLTLLRRMGHVTEAFSDEQLLTIADISGVSDNALRKMHLDNLPPPPELADTLRLFKAFQDVAQIIQQAQGDQPINDRYLYVLPMVTELPRWPQGRVLEVFETPELTGPSVKYGAERRVVPGSDKAPITISRADIMKGELPARILQALDESEINHLLGDEAAGIKASRPETFSKQLADYIMTRQPEVFESFYQGTAAKPLQVRRLQQVVPGLSESAANAVLALADREELERMANTTRVPLRMLEHARWYAQQGQLSRAYAGLYMENMASADSKRLALHALQKLPGWSDNVRLEIRDTHLRGTLIDGIGSETARVRRYLLKNGPVYQAFDERGGALNILPVSGDNFFPSLAHALPGANRRALGVLATAPEVVLRKLIIDYAVEHSDEMAGVLEQRTARKRMHKPPIRVRDKLVGYYASGRGTGRDTSLLARVRDVYPDLTDLQANGYILNLRRTGQTDVQIRAHLRKQLSEWGALESTLNAWAAGRYPALQAFTHGRRAVADSLKASWRHAPLADLNHGFARLSLISFDPLPSITADFSHVRDLKLIVPNADAFLARCPSVQTLEVQVVQDNVQSVFSSLNGLQKLTTLNLYTPITAQVTSNLKAFSHLEGLSLVAPVNVRVEPGGSAVLDVRGFERLRSLNVSDRQMRQWPTGVLELPLLERLNMRATAVNTLPAGLHPGHDRLLAGLSLDWSNVAREDFKPMYEYLRSHPQHLIDLNEMVGDYCKGQLFHLAEIDVRYLSVLRTHAAELWPQSQARFDAIEALSVQRSELDRQLGLWLGNTSQQAPERSSMDTVAHALKVSWRSELVRRYIALTGLPLHAFGLSELTRNPSVFGFSDLQLTSLPQLPAGAFGHVNILSLKNMRVPGQHLRHFIQGFNETRTLDLSGGELTDVPFTSADLPQLEHLNLSDNPLTSLDVSAMSRLHSLSLRGTQLKAWPTGAENLSELSWLDMRDSSVTTLPKEALARDQVLINLHLSGTSLSEQTEADLAAARQKFEQTWGLLPGALGKLALEPVPDVFTPSRDSLGTRHLLPLLPAEPPENMQSLTPRVRRLHPAINVDEVQEWIDDMHAEGVTDPQLHERIDGWDQTLEALTRRLNSWLLTRESREPDQMALSQTRRAAALRIVECWRDGLLVAGSEPQAQLELSGLQVGDLPQLPTSFAHVGTLQLRDVRLSEQGSNDFLRAFPNVHTLDLSDNSLQQTLPEAIAGMSHLRHLDLSSTGFTAPDALHAALTGLEDLQGLDLGNCDLDSFRLEGFRQLQNLDLSNNRLTQWPEGVWQVESLIGLNLASNDLTSIPPEALDGTHDLLMTNTYLFDNHELTRDALEQLRGYADERHLDPVLGFTRSELDQLIDGSGSDFSEESEPEGIVPDEVVPEGQAGDEHLAIWLESLAPQQRPDSQALWAQLANEPGREEFFHLLGRLAETKEFRFSRSDLTRRVWEVMRAAGSDSELRQVLFRSSDTWGTCEDGRILTFSELEVRVFAHNALLEIDPARLDQKGPALLRLSRRLFRLEEVERLANEDTTAQEQHADSAEVRLEYRLGLKDLLDLPGQPRHMMFGRPISGETLTKALEAVNNAEASDKLYENLITRDYWVAYLKQKNPEVFAALDRNESARHYQLELDYPGLNNGYDEALEVLGIELKTERNLKLIELSRQEAAPAPPVRDPNQPGPSRDLKGAP